VGLGLQIPGLGGRARIRIVDERDAVADEHVVANRHAFANECVARNLAALAHGRVLLDFHERADLGLVSDLTTVEVDESGEPYVFPQLHVRGNGEVLIHWSGGYAAPLPAMTAAGVCSRIFTSVHTDTPLA